jgi:hypothetical protein
MKTRRLRLPATPSPAVEKLRDYLRAIYAAPMPWHEENQSAKMHFETLATAVTAPQPDGVSQPAVSKALNITKKEVTKKRLYLTEPGFYHKMIKPHSPDPRARGGV